MSSNIGGGGGGVKRVATCQVTRLGGEAKLRILCCFEKAVSNNRGNSRALSKPMMRVIRPHAKALV